MKGNEDCNNRVSQMRNKFEKLEEKPPTPPIQAKKSPPSQLLVSNTKKVIVKRTPAFRLNNPIFQRSNSQSRISVPEVGSFVRQPMVKSRSSADFSEACAKIRLSNKAVDLYTEPIPKSCRTGKSNELIEILNRPLPTGPAPKKPPRTFAHNSSCKDPKYMLNKLEEALKSNRLKTPRKFVVTSDEEYDDHTNIHTKNWQRVLPTPPPPPTPPPSIRSSIKLNCLDGCISNGSIYDTLSKTNTHFYDGNQRVSNEEPLYSELKQPQNSNKTSLHYMSTPICINHPENNTAFKSYLKPIIQDDVQSLNQSNWNQQQSLADSTSISSTRSLSDLVEQKSSGPIQNLIKSFETRIPQENNNNNDRINELRSDLEQTLEQCFNGDDNTNKALEITKKFETYVRTMPKYQTPNNQNHLFWCLLMIEWTGRNVRARIKFKYPTNVEVPFKLIELCYPETETGPLDRTNSAQCYTIALTNEKGERTFGYCRRQIGPKTHQTNDTPILMYCVLSRHRAPRFYKTILKELELQCGKLHTEKERIEYVRSLYRLAFPQPGETLRIRDMVLMRHRDSRYEDADLKPLHEHLSASILLKIFSSLLLERKVILISCIIGKLSCCVDALQSVLYPFSWPHTFIPILPQCLWDIVEAPTPVLCGILSVAVVNRYRIENALVVDLDEGSVLIEEGDEDKILCQQMQKVWYKGMQLANTIPRHEYVYSVYLSDAYIQVFIVCLRNYKNFISNGVYLKHALVRSVRSKTIRRFLKWFLETAMFTTFSDTLLTNPNSFPLFDRKIEMYGSDQSTVILDKLLDWKR